MALPPVAILISTTPSTSALRVFLFVDPELVSPSVCSALLLEIQAAQTQQTPEACMRHVVAHTLQAALGGACRADTLQRKLQVIALPQPLWVPVQGPHQLLTVLIFPHPVAILSFFMNQKLIHRTYWQLTFWYVSLMIMTMIVLTATVYWMFVVLQALC